MSHLIVLMINVLEHLDDEAALSEAYRICRKNVIFSVTHEQEEELGEYNLIYSAYGDPTHLRHYGNERICSTFASTGFEICEIAFELPINPFGLFPKIVAFAAPLDVCCWSIRQHATRGEEILYEH